MEKEVGEAAGPHLHSSGAVEGTELIRWGCSRAGQGHTPAVFSSVTSGGEHFLCSDPSAFQVSGTQAPDLEEPLLLLELH